VLKAATLQIVQMVVGPPKSFLAEHEGSPVQVIDNLRGGPIAIDTRWYATSHCAWQTRPQSLDMFLKRHFHLTFALTLQLCHLCEHCALLLLALLSTCVQLCVIRAPQGSYQRCRVQVIIKSCTVRTLGRSTTAEGAIGDRRWLGSRSRHATSRGML